MHSSEDDKGLILSIDHMPSSKNKVLDDTEVLKIIPEQNCIKKLIGDGDFRSNECIEYLIESDIVVTNPPFSKFIELFSLLTKYNKQYLLISNQKQRALERYAEELLDYLDENKTHQFYWEKPIRQRNKPIHPMENDESLPEKIKGKHFDSWTQIAKELGYGK